MKFKKIISIACLVVLITVLVIVMYQRIVLKTELIKISNYAFLVVLTGSMEPNIKAGDMIIIKSQKEYLVGDVVTYRTDDDIFVTHRIVRIEDNKYITQGDANNIEDSAVFINQIEGKVIMHSHILGFIVLHLLKPITCFYIAYVIFAENKDKFEIGANHEVKQSN